MSDSIVRGVPHLSVTISFCDPNTHLAWPATRTMLAQLSGETTEPSITWWHLSAVARSSSVKSKDPEGRGDRHRRIRSAYRDADILRYAQRLGRPITNLAHSRQLDVSIAAMGLSWLQSVAGQEQVAGYIDDVFQAGWVRAVAKLDMPMVTTFVGRQLADSDVAVQDFSAYVAGPGLAELADLQTELSAAGIFDTPTYLVGDEIFIGRAHLPLISERLYPT